VPAESGIDVLVQFARLASEARTGNGILPRLADALVAHSDAAAVAVLEIRPGGEAALVNSPHLPKELVGLRVDADTIGEELGGRLLATCQGRFQGVRAHPLVGASRLFGMVVLFFHSQGPPEQLPLAEGLIDLAAIVLGSAVQVQDLTRSHAELRASQETLVRTEKLRALGQMAAGVSHDLKNILNPLSLHVEVIARAIARGSTAEAQDNVAQIKQVLRRGVQTVERFQDYGRQSPESRSEQIDLNHLVSEAADIARPRMASHGPRLHHLREELGSPAVVLGRSEEILSALVNLIVNAIDAMPGGGGTITLRTGVSGERSWVEVADDGPGIPPEIEQRIFEPFFTTKGEEGTGLGLATVHACMQRHGGSVELSTAIGKGTTFRLWFPSASTPG
jgi:signal transduction histidine kinase